MRIDDVIDSYVEQSSTEQSILLLKVLACREQGGLGYTLRLFNPRVDIDGWEFDHRAKVIYLDTSSVFSKYSARELAETLLESIETEIAESRATLLARVGWGTGKVVLGVVEAGVGLVGIVVPEPGTTVAGVVVFSLGANTIADGFSQLAGANKGHGYNILSELAGSAGAGLADLAGADRQVGKMVGKGVFLVSSVALGSLGSIRILKIPNQTFLRMGVGGQPGGVQVGRLDLLYGSYRAKDGMTVLSITNNANKSILRFVTHDGRLLVNGRIFGVQRVLRHESSPREIIKGLLKLLVHGAKS